MPNPVSISFREQTTGRINDLLLDEGVACALTQNLLGYLAGALLNYKDEGVSLTPDFLVCDGLDQLLKSFPGAISYVIGTTSLSSEEAAKIIKDCGPLSSRNWYVFIERIEGNQVRYGVFTYFRLPSAISLSEGITIDPARFCVLIRKVSENTMEISGAKGSKLSLLFSTSREASNFGEEVGKFVSYCVREIAEIDENFVTYFRRLIDSALASSHGTIFICTDRSTITEVTGFEDAVALLPPLDFFESYSEFKRSGSAASILSLQSCEELLQGFLRCDGMVVLDTACRVIAYRVFYRPVVNAPAIPKVVGGARRRAFEGAKSVLGYGLISLLFRSQDGLTLHCGADL